MSTPTESLGVLMLTKTGKVTRNSRSARTYFVRVETQDGRVFRSRKSFTSEHLAAIKCSEILRSEGLPSGWDSDVLELHYTEVN